MCWSRAVIEYALVKELLWLSKVQAMFTWSVVMSKVIAGKNRKKSCVWLSSKGPSVKTVDNAEMTLIEIVIKSYPCLLCPVSAAFSEQVSLSLSRLPCWLPHMELKATTFLWWLQPTSETASQRQQPFHHWAIFLLTLRSLGGGWWWRRGTFNAQ